MIIISDFSYFQLAFFVGFILTGNFGLMHAIIIRLDQYFESDLQKTTWDVHCTVAELL